MTTDRLCLVPVMLTLTVGCGSKAPADEQGGSQAGLRAMIKSQTYTATETGILTDTDTRTTTQTSTSTQTPTYTQSFTGTHTQTAAGSTITKTATTYNIPVSATNVGTVTDRNDYVAAKTYISTATLTRADTAGATFTKTMSATGTYADNGVVYTGSGTTTATLAFFSFATSTTTQTVAANFSGQVSRTIPATGTGTAYGSMTWTYTKTATGMHTDTLTQTNTQTLTQTTTSTDTNTATLTITITNTVTNTVTLTDCDDGNVCTDDSYNPATGCVYTNNTAPCNDQNTCTTNDTCSGGSCVGGAPNCDDGNACTIDSCNGDGTCAHSLMANYCIIDGVCYANGASGKQCQICDSTQPTKWSNKTAGSACMNVQPGTCDPQGICITSCGDDAMPGDSEIIIWNGPTYYGACKTLSASVSQGRFPNPTALEPVGENMLSSIKVGAKVRALVFQDAAKYDVNSPASDHYVFGGAVATFEAGSAHSLLGSDPSLKLNPTLELGPDVAYDASAIIVSPENDQRVAYTFLGDYPHDTDDPPFSENTQGICHSDTNWFFNNTWNLFRIPLTSNLDRSDAADNVSAPLPGPPADCKNKINGTECQFQHSAYCDWYSAQQAQHQDILGGCNHMGDADFSQEHNLIFVPVENCCAGPSVAVYNTDLKVIAVTRLTQQNGAGWVAIDPRGIPGVPWTRGREMRLWSSNSGISATGSQGMFVYTIAWEKLDGKAPIGPTYMGIPTTDFLTLVPDAAPTLRDINGEQLGVDYMQGGVFSRDLRDLTHWRDGSVFYISTSHSDAHGIFAFDPVSGGLLANSGDNRGQFNFEREYPGDLPVIGDDLNQEEEGLDYLDQAAYYDTHNGTVMPGGGELHAILNFNFESKVSLKHYAAHPDTFCHIPPSADEVTIYSDKDFSNTCRTLKVGEYPDFRWLYPMPDGYISSIQVGAGVKAELFDDSYYGGAELDLPNPAACTCAASAMPSCFIGKLADCFSDGQWNDRPSSIKVIAR